MRTSKQTFSLLGLLTLLADPSAQLGGVPIGTAFTYHGRLTDSGAPATGAYDFYCLLYDAQTGGNPVGDRVRRDAVVVSEGMFLLELDFGPDAFAGEARWLEIQVRPSGPDPYTTLSPRQRISPTPYALYASKAGLAAQATSAGLAAQATTALGVADHSVTGAGIADGTITRADLGRNTVWMAGGNAGTEPGTHFLGTVDAQPLSLRVNDAEAARFATNGDLGLGTATPTQKLDVAGSIAYSGQLTKLDVAENQAATVRAANFEFGHSTRRGGPGLALVDWGPALQLNYDGWSSTWLGGTTVVDPEDANDGMLMPGLAFGQNSGEGIASRRAEGENRWGLDFYTDGASRLSVANNGNVGIGTRSPQAKLDVAAGDALVRGPDFGAPGDSAHLYLGDESHYIRSVWGSGLRLGTYQAPDAFVLQETSGNVGIGTSEPQSRLHVAGRIRAAQAGTSATIEAINTGPGPAVSGSGSAGSTGVLGIEDYAVYGESMNGYAGYFEGDGHFSGSVGIGTTEPQAKLGVNGLVRAQTFGSMSGQATVEFVADNIGALRLERTNDSALDSDLDADGAPNVIGGSSNNWVASNVVGATIGGGGASSYNGSPLPNSIGGDYASIGGGLGNTIQTSAWLATIGGGSYNDISASGFGAAIGGGSSNSVGYQSSFATIGGGVGNEILDHAESATIPGGHSNIATSYAFAAGSFANAVHKGAFVWADSTVAPFLSLRDNQFRVRATGGAGFNVNDGAWVDIWVTGTQLIRTSTGAYLTTGGSWTNSSDAAEKENHRAVDPRAILARVVALRITNWNYKAESAAVRHLGPVAQEFHATFGLGGDDRAIGTLDADGVALSAIQGLHEILREKDAEIADIKKQNSDLQQRVSALETLVEKLDQDW